MVVDVGHLIRSKEVDYLNLEVGVPQTVRSKGDVLTGSAACQP